VDSAYSDIKIQQITIRHKATHFVDSLDYKIERYALCLFDFDSDKFTPLHSNILTEIKKSIQPNSTVYIYGYADRTGDPQHNLDLSRRRSEAVRNNLNISNVHLEAVGNERLIYNNDLPEGRAFSRTVRIEIHTPNK
jgi:outer membrane protein OmpA-like peptidoglycan-associated protein